MALDPTASAIDALVTYIATVSGVAAAKRGWPEHQEDLDLSSGPVVSVTQIGAANGVYVSPTQVDSAAVGDDTQITYLVAYTDMLVQIDLWAPYRFDRDAVGDAMEQAFHNVLPRKSGLELTHSDYYSRSINGMVTGRPQTMDGPKSSAGEWRKSWTMRLDSDLVAFATHPKQALIRLKVSTDLDGLVIAEPDHDLIP